MVEQSSNNNRHSHGNVSSGYEIMKTNKNIVFPKGFKVVRAN